MGPISRSFFSPTQLFLPVFLMAKKVYFGILQIATHAFFKINKYNTCAKLSNILQSNKKFLVHLS